MMERVTLRYFQSNPCDARQHTGSSGGPIPVRHCRHLVERAMCLCYLTAVLDQVTSGSREHGLENTGH